MSRLTSLSSIYGNSYFLDVPVSHFIIGYIEWKTSRGQSEKSRRKNKTILRPAHCIDIYVLISHFVTPFELKINTLGFYGEKIIGCQR